jgi:hypothetical protein
MINCYNNPTEHPGKQPIRVLRHNISHSFQNIHSDIKNNHEILKQKGFLKDTIIYIVDNSLPIFPDDGSEEQIPYVKSDGTITIHEVFLTYLWCITFCMHTLVYKIVHKREKQMPPDAMAIECCRLYDFAMSLRKQFHILDKNNFINPEYYREDNKFYVETSNTIFVYAVDYILLHEYSHAVKRLFGGTIKDEENADFEAGRLMIEGAKSNDDLAHRAIGGVIGLSSLLLLSGNTHSTTHPETDKRILNFLKQLNHKDDNSEIWGLACLIFAFWDATNSLKLDFQFDNLGISYKERFIAMVES